MNAKYAEFTRLKYTNDYVHLEIESKRKVHLLNFLLEKDEIPIQSKLLVTHSVL